MITSGFMMTLLSCTVSATLTVVPNQRQLEVVPLVDLSRYVGRWYEIARSPNRFQKKCLDSVTAEYSIRPDGKIDVVRGSKHGVVESIEAHGEAA